jgi:ABC-type multidrug transport system ATPase subunit
VNAPLLTAREVTKSYGRTLVLDGVSLEAARGEILGIAGENGAGKSTLLRILAGLIRPDSGRVRIDGRLGYCDQESHLFPDLTVAEHFEYFARAYGIAATSDWLGVRDGLLQRFRFPQYLDAKPKELSGGTRQKLHFSLALIHQPDVVILDEPFLAFDWDTYLTFWDEAERLKSAGAALVIVSHVAHDRERFTRIFELSSGALH